MRKSLFIIVLLVVFIPLFAQKSVTKFMGIPIDGFKPEMIQKLKEKGFVSSADDKNILEGEFNGTQVNVHVVTNNNKVYRIMLCDTYPMGETDIKIRFNRLCQQFKNNSNYITLGDYTIADDEDISYELTVHDKRYEAVFYQKPRILFTTLWFITFVHSKKCTTFDLPKRKDAPRGNILQPIVDFPKIYYRWLQDTHYLRDQLSKKHPRLEPVTGSPSADFSFQPSLF